MVGHATAEGAIGAGWAEGCAAIEAGALIESAALLFGITETQAAFFAKVFSSYAALLASANV